MTTLRNFELTCPTCFNAFSSDAVRSTNALGGKATDIHERAAGTQPLPYSIHTCPNCGYTGGAHDFGDETELSPTIKDHVWGELAPKPPSVRCSPIWWASCGAAPATYGRRGSGSDERWRQAWCCSGAAFHR
jgi:uncharacterized protein